MAIIRMVAMIVLLTGVADFVSFDRFDPFASMSAAGTAAGAVCPVHGLKHGYYPDKMGSILLPDDGCLFCGAGIPIARIGIEASLVVVDFRLHYPLIESALLANAPHLPPKNHLS